MAHLKLSLLGPFTVTLADQPVAFAYDKVRALLAYLAVESAEPQHREVVADLLWAGYPEPSARQSLSQALSTLRGALADRDADTPFVLVTPRDLHFNAAGDAWLDVDELTRRLAAVQSHPHAALPTCDACVAHLEAAVALYRGDFLADLLVEDSAPFEEWALLKRENLRRTILDALAQLAEAYLQRGAADAALRCARRQLELDDWRETAHRQVMRALVLSGQRTAAIAHYEACRQALATGLGVEPEAATLELAHLLKSNTLIVDTPFPGAGGGPGLDLIGRAVGSYLVVERLGQGGMAEVYKAYHTRLGRYVALKFIRPELLQPAALQAFEQEARTLAQLNHPNVIQVYDYGELALGAAQRHDAIPPRPYLVMEYVAGETLKAWLPEGTALPLDQVWPILQQISVALDYAHEHGVIHRDIKPGNIMLTPDGHALLGDFGISKLLRPGEDAAYTVATTGTPAYMAPEQVDSTIGPISAATDVYALGLMTYEMLTGQRPFQADSLLAEMAQRVQKDPTPPSRYRPDIPPAVEQVLLRALARDPQARYARAGAFARALAAAAPQLLLEHPSAHVPAWWPQLAAALEPTPGPAPFKGLQHFEVADAEWFFGREALVTRLVRQVIPAAPHDRRAGQASFLAIVGASGSGKSSLVRAGLVAALLREAALTVHVLTPTAHPLEALALTLTHDSESVTAAATLMDDMARDARSLRLYLQRSGGLADRRISGSADQRSDGAANQQIPPSTNQQIPPLLVIDQFEEVFTLCRDAAAREAFVANLLTAGGAASPGTEADAAAFVVITLRADFYEHCAQYPELREALGRYQVYIGPMTADGLRHAIEEPARRGGWEFEPGLVDLLLRDVGAEAGHQPEPGALPLLSHALLETWQRRRERTLTLGGYAEAGGVRGAIAKTAEAVYQGLDAEQQAIARNLFLRLTELGEGTQDTRRRPGLAEVRSCHADGAAVDRVLAQLADARLITTEQETVQVAHEALIREWPTLRGWLEEDREGLRVHRHLTEAAQAWAQLGRDPGELYRGARLAQAAEWAAAHSDALNTLEREFLAAAQSDAEREEAEREAQRQRELEAAQRLAEAEKRRAEEGQAAARQLRRRARYLAVAAAGILLVAVAAVVLWNWARITSRENATLAGENAQIAATAVAVSEMEATQRAAAETARSAEEAARIEADAQRTEAETARNEAEDARDEAQQQARRARASQLAAQAPTLLDEEIDLALLLGVQAYNTYDLPQSRGALLEVLDFYSGLIRILSGHEIDVHSVVFSPDGKWLASADLDNTIQLWNVEGDWSLERTIRQGINTSSVNYNVKENINDVMAFNPDSRMIALGDWTSPMLVLWEVATGKKLRTLEGQTDGFRTLAFSPDGKLLASGSRDGLLTLWDVETGESLIPPLRVYKEGLDELSFHPDGKTLATAGCLDRKGHSLDACFQSEMHLWDVEKLLAFDAPSPINVRERISQTIPGPAAGIESLAFTPDGLRLMIQGSKGRRPDGWELNPVIILWDLLRNESVGEISFEKAERAQYVGHTAISPDNALFVTPGEPGETIQVWDMQILQPIKSIPSFGYSAKTNIFNPQGSILALGLENGDVYLWDVATLLHATGNAGGSGAYFATYNRTEGGSLLTSLAFSPDGNTLAAGSYDGGVSVWDVATGEAIRNPLTVHGRSVFDLDFSPDGAKLATASFDGTIRLWDTASWEMLGEPLTGHTSAVTYVAWSLDGKTLFSSSYDGTIRRWDVATGQPVGEPRAEHTDQTLGITISPDGTLLASASRDTTVRLWNVATGEPIGEPLVGHTAGVGDVAFSLDGKLLASCGHDATIRLWDVETRQPLGGPLTGHQDRVWAVAFSHDGKTLTSVDMDGKLRYWDIATHRAIGAPIQAHIAAAFDATFNPDGTILATAGGDEKGNGDIRFWDINPISWQTRVCNIVGRNLTQSEWERYLPDVPYEKTCPQWPAGE